MKNKVIIYKGSKSPTQSGRNKTRFWYLKFDESLIYEEDVMTGWKGNTLPKYKTKIKFSNLDSAIAYADSKNYKYEVIKTSAEKIKIKSYAENFKYNRYKVEID